MPMRPGFAGLIGRAAGRAVSMTEGRGRGPKDEIIPSLTGAVEGSRMAGEKKNRNNNQQKSRKAVPRYRDAGNLCLGKHVKSSQAQMRKGNMLDVSNKT